MKIQLVNLSNGNLDGSILFRRYQNINMKENIEVEVRGLLSEEQYAKLKDFFDNHADLKVQRRRTLIDFSGDVENRTKDIRIRNTNNKPEIVIKLGSWGGSESREEILVEVKEGSFKTLVKAFGEMGFKKGVLCVRNSVVYEYKGIEFALVEVPNHSFYFEAEILTTEEDAQKAEEEIRKVCEELGLNPFSKEEFFAYVNLLNQEANSVYDYENFKGDDFG